MRLLPVPAGTLRPGEPAPVDIYDDDGSLLLAEGQAADNEKLAQVLATRRVFINESLAHKWKGLSPSPLKNMLRPATATSTGPAPTGDLKPGKASSWTRASPRSFPSRRSGMPCTGC